METGINHAGCCDFQDYGHVRHPYREYLEASCTGTAPDTGAETGHAIPRGYELTRLDKANVIRSLGGAAERSRDGRVLLGFCTRTESLPDEFDQIRTAGGGSYIEAWSQGRFNGDFLLMECSGGHPGGELFEAEAGIRLREIEPPVFVSYGERVRPVIQPCRCPVCGKGFEMDIGFAPADSGDAPVIGMGSPWDLTCHECDARAGQVFGSVLLEDLWAAGELDLAGWFVRTAAAVPESSVPVSA